MATNIEVEPTSLGETAARAVCERGEGGRDSLKVSREDGRVVRDIT